MATRRMLTDTVVLANYAGEVDDVATYQETVLTYCYCPLKEGTSEGRQGVSPSNSGRLYIFDHATVAKGSDGQPRTYLPFDEWKFLDDKTPYWTISTSGKDYFVKEGSSTKMRIAAFKHHAAGSKRMHHFEVDGR